jgi:hypothetical protein
MSAVSALAMLGLFFAEERKTVARRANQLVVIAE